MSEDIDISKVEAMAGKVVGDIAGALSLFMAYLGDQAGVFTALDGRGGSPSTSWPRRPATMPSTSTNGSVRSRPRAT